MKISDTVKMESIKKREMTLSKIVLQDKDASHVILPPQESSPKVYYEEGDGFISIYNDINCSNPIVLEIDIVCTVETEKRNFSKLKLNGVILGIMVENPYAVLIEEENDIIVVIKEKNGSPRNMVILILENKDSRNM